MWLATFPSPFGSRRPPASPKELQERGVGCSVKMDLGLCPISSAAWALGTGAGQGAKPLGPLPTAELGWPRGEPPECP